MSDFINTTYKRIILIFISYISLVSAVLFVFNTSFVNWREFSIGDILLYAIIKIILIIIFARTMHNFIKAQLILPFRKWDGKGQFKNNIITIYLDKREKLKIEQIQNRFRSGTYIENNDGSYTKIIGYKFFTPNMKRKNYQRVDISCKTLTPDEYEKDKKKNADVVTTKIEQQVIVKGDNSGIISNNAKNSPHFQKMF